MALNELRKDYLLDRWVVIATERGRRPTDFVKQRGQQAKIGVCPLCPSNEHMTPPAVLIYLRSRHGIKKSKDEGESRHKKWLIRVVPNLYPAFSLPRRSISKRQIIRSENLRLAVGHHEILVESPIHDEHPADAGIPQLIHVINGYVDRLRELSAKPYVQYVSIFRNHGLEAGASLSHAHSQIVATPDVPRIVKEELIASKVYWKKNKRCVFCDIIESERSGPRFIFENARFLVFAPYASINPMEFWIFPSRHQTSLLEMSSNEVRLLAETMKISLSRLKTLVNDPPYNYGFHMAISKDATDCFHWHIEIYPKLAIWAGFEKSTGTYINTMTPETAAESLRASNKNI